MFFVVCNLRTREFQTEEEAAAVTEELKELIYPDFEKRKLVGESFRKNNIFSKTAENYLEFLKDI